MPILLAIKSFGPASPHLFGVNITLWSYKLALELSPQTNHSFHTSFVVLVAPRLQVALNLINGDSGRKKEERKNRER